MWFGVFGWGAGLLLWIIAAAVVTGGGFLGGGFLGLLASLCWLFGTVAFVIWLVKNLVTHKLTLNNFLEAVSLS
ncbi:MAG: hypothetical protein IPF93_13470 [Saprospiraceae bacterium]|nr:hypothetical protein [Saprospiraceae bacterium]